jgi:hypothetical protein
MILGDTCNVLGAEHKCIQGFRRKTPEIKDQLKGAGVTVREY